MMQKWQAKRLVAAFGIGLFSSLLTSAAQAETYSVLVPEKSRVGFTFRQMGVPVSGQFKKFGAQFQIDPQKPEVAKAALEIQIASIDAGSAEANDEVLGKSWFNAKQFPTARFVLDKLVAQGNGSYQLSGQLTIRNRTLPLTTPATFKQEAGAGVFSGKWQLKRSDFALGEGMWADTSVVANEIEVNFQLAVKPSASK